CSTRARSRFRFVSFNRLATQSYSRFQSTGSGRSSPAKMRPRQSTDAAPGTGVAAGSSTMDAASETASGVPARSVRVERVQARNCGGARRDQQQVEAAGRGVREMEAEAPSDEEPRRYEEHRPRRAQSAHRHALAGTKSAKVDARKTQMKIDNSSATSSDEIRPAMFVPHSLHYAPPVAAGASRCSPDSRPISVFDPSLLQPVRSQPLARAGEGCGLKRA